MRRTTIFLEERLIQRAKQTARAEGRSFASLIRDAIAQYLAGRRPAGARLPAITGAYDSGTTDTAECSEELLGTLIQEDHHERSG